jgi:hypothetical protein
MNVLETEWWTMAIPPEWWADAEEDSILVGDRDEVGCIEISTMRKETGDFESGAAKDIAQAESEEPLEWQVVTLGEFQGYRSDYVEEGAAVRQWYVTHGALLLFITYSCDEENRGMDDAAVDEILDTLMVLEANP